MAKELTTISPEGLEIANAYLQFGSISEVCNVMELAENIVVDFLNKREVKTYLDTIFLDRGYRNREKIGELLDKMIESKLEEAEETGQFSNKDLADLLQMAHNMRKDELKHQVDKTSVKNQMNVQINEGLPLGAGNLGKLIHDLIQGESADK